MFTFFWMFLVTFSGTSFTAFTIMNWFFCKTIFEPMPPIVLFRIFDFQFWRPKIRAVKLKSSSLKNRFLSIFFFSDVFSKIGNNTIVRFIDTIRLQKNESHIFKTVKLVPRSVWKFGTSSRLSGWSMTNDISQQTGLICYLNRSQ